MELICKETVASNRSSRIEFGVGNTDTHRHRHTDGDKRAHMQERKRAAVRDKMCCQWRR